MGVFVSRRTTPRLSRGCAKMRRMKRPPHLRRELVMKMNYARVACQNRGGNQTAMWDAAVLAWRSAARVGINQSCSKIFCILKKYNISTLAYKIWNLEWDEGPMPKEEIINCTVFSSLTKPMNKPNNKDKTHHSRPLWLMVKYLSWFRRSTLVPITLR